ncbi:MAG: hypothetical protein WBB46_11220 [Candidatus Deferrimicrobiaceae bacterium]
MMRKIRLISLLAAGILIFPVIVMGAFGFSNPFPISDPALLFLFGFLLIVLGSRGLKRPKL